MLSLKPTYEQLVARWDELGKLYNERCDELSDLQAEYEALEGRVEELRQATDLAIPILRGYASLQHRLQNVLNLRDATVNDAIDAADGVADRLEELLSAFNEQPTEPETFRRSSHSELPIRVDEETAKRVKPEVLGPGLAGAMEIEPGERCSECKGTGFGTLQMCSACGGTGKSQDAKEET